MNELELMVVVMFGRFEINLNFPKSQIDLLLRIFPVRAFWEKLMSRAVPMLGGNTNE